MALILALGFWAAAPVVVGWTPTTVMSASMAPAIEAGDVVVSRPVPRDALLPGRVVLATDPDRPDRLRLHRIAGIDGDGMLITKGDANPAADTATLSPDAVRGVGVLRVPWAGLPVVWIRSGEMVPLAAVTLAFLACLTLAVRQGVDDEDDEPPPRPPHGHAVGPLTRRQARASLGSARRRRSSVRARAATGSPAPVAPGAAVEPGADVAPGATVAPGADVVPTTRRARRVLGLTSAVVVAMGVAATPAGATFSDASPASAQVTAGRATAAASLGCINDGGAVITWSYDGSMPRSFDLLVDGRVVASGIPPRSRSARVPNDGSYSIFRTARVTVRTNVGTEWTAESPASVAVGGVLFGFGRPFCR